MEARPNLLVDPFVYKKIKYVKSVPPTNDLRHVLQCVPCFGEANV